MRIITHLNPDIADFCHRYRGFVLIEFVHRLTPVATCCCRFAAL
jgi:hypothetical protein